VKFLAIIAACLLFLSCNRPTELPRSAQQPPETAAKDDQYRKELDDIKKTMRSEVKIKLKKDGKGAYSWEIQGKDAAEVLKTNDTLKKKLGE